jgi:hypothetical protein
MSREVVRLQMPERLEPKNTARTLMVSVRGYFYALYNSTNKAFVDLLASVGHKDSIHGNRLFDRHVAVGMIKKAALDAKDTFTANAKDGDVYRCIVNLMSQHDMGLKLRRSQYRAIMQQVPAE